MTSDNLNFESVFSVKAKSVEVVEYRHNLTTCRQGIFDPLAHNGNLEFILERYASLGVSCIQLDTSMRFCVGSDSIPPPAYQRTILCALQMHRVHGINRVPTSEFEPAAEVRKPSSDDENNVDIGHGRPWHVWESVSLYTEREVHGGIGNGMHIPRELLGHWEL